MIPTFKRISELLGNHLATATDLEIIHLRISGSWGPLGHQPNFAFPAPRFVYAAATGGVWIVSADGKRLGRIPAPEGIRFANLAFGDPDSKTLYIVSAKNLWRIRVKIPGFRP